MVSACRGWTRKVLADQQLAREIGISGVPALLISAGERGILISGAQPYEVVERALEQASKPA